MDGSQYDRFIREPECKKISGLSRTTRWRLERQGKFPKRRQISDSTVGWLESEIQGWVAERIAASHKAEATNGKP